MRLYDVPLPFLRSLMAAFSMCLFASTTALAGSGGNSVRGGGSALVCGDSAPQIFDLFVMRQDGLKARNLDRSETLDAILRRLGSHSELLGHVLSEWNALPPVDAWPRSSTRPKVAPISDAYPSGTLLPTCRIVLISQFAERGAPTLFPELYGLLPESDRIVLELHEAIYRAGVKFFGQRNAVLAQKLVGAVLAREIPWPELKKRIELFVRAAVPRVDETTGAFRLAREADYCDPLLALNATGGYGTQATLGGRNHGRTYRLSGMTPTSSALYPGVASVMIPSNEGGCLYERIRVEAFSDEMLAATLEHDLLY